VLEEVDCTPSALRADLAGGAVSVARLHSAAELIAHAADLCSDSAGLLHGNERRWRTSRNESTESSTLRGDGVETGHRDDDVTGADCARSPLTH